MSKNRIKKPTRTISAKKAMALMRQEIGECRRENLNLRQDIASVRAERDLLKQDVAQMQASPPPRLADVKANAALIVEIVLAARAR